MLALNIASLGGDSNPNNLIDSIEESGTVKLILDGKEHILTVREAMQTAANLLTEASVAAGMKPITTSPKFTEDDFLRALYDAEKHFHGTGYVGLNHFMSKWKSPYLHRDKAERQKLLSKLDKRGLVEIYDAEDSKAIKLDKDVFLKFETELNSNG